MARENVWKGALAGAVAGLVASFAMNQFQSVASRLANVAANTGKRSTQNDQQGDDATVKTAEAVSQGVLGHNLQESEKTPAGSAVHYSFGGALGAVYGVLAETVPASTIGYGTLYGSAVWLAADEIGVPAARLSPPPTQAPMSSHMSALASHLVYGVVTDVVRRAILSGLN